MHKTQGVCLGVHNGWGPGMCPMAAAHGGQAADPCPSQGPGCSHTPGSPTLVSGIPGGAPCPGPCPSLLLVLPTPGSDWHP